MIDTWMFYHLDRASTCANCEGVLPGFKHFYMEDRAGDKHCHLVFRARVQLALINGIRAAVRSRGMVCNAA